MKKILSCVMFVFILSGCAAKMAAEGQDGPNLSQVKKEYSRTEIEKLTGPPRSESKLSNGHTITSYEVKSHIEPSLIRAAGHSFLDLVTMGLWELAASPIEQYRQSSKQEITVYYGPDNRVVNLKINGEPASIY